MGRARGGGRTVSSPRTRDEVARGIRGRDAARWIHLCVSAAAVVAVVVDAASSHGWV